MLCVLYTYIYANTIYIYATDASASLVPARIDLTCHPAYVLYAYVVYSILIYILMCNIYTQ